MEGMFSFRGIQDLCRMHFGEIKERKEMKSVLDGRRVRFINPAGEFDYTYFGDFYFVGDVMMLITKDKDYTIYHKPDQISNTLWSTVPVIFAGVDTWYKDDVGREIFTGDVVTYQNYTSIVRHFGDSKVPGLAGDNCEILFKENATMHKEGTAFTGISQTMFHEFDPNFIYWAKSGFSYGGMSFEDVKEKAALSIKAPTFIDEAPKRKRYPRRVYHESIDEVLKEDRALAYFRDWDESEDENGEQMYCIYADNLPEGYAGKTYEIKMPSDSDLYTDLHHAIQDFLLYAHRHPETIFILCDFLGVLSIPEDMHEKVAMMFHDWYTYFIPNVILPSWVLWETGAFEQIGKD